MASYDNLDSLITDLKLARIAAWMRKEGWFGTATSGFSKIETVGGYPYSSEVSGTDASGNGGGRYTFGGVEQDHITDYSDGFSAIVSAVDDHLERWRDLPDPDRIQQWIDPMRLATSEIAISAVDTAGAPTGGGEVVGAINLALSAAEEWAGGTASAFKLGFLSKLGSAVGGQYALCLCLGGHLEAEKGIWTETRQGVADIVDQTKKAYDAVTYDSGLDWSLAFKVLGYAAAGAAIFATGGAAIPVAVAGLGITVAAETYEAANSEQEAPSVTYDSVRDKMPQLFDALASDVREEEAKIRDNLNHNLNVVLANKDSFDLARPALLDIDDDSDFSNDNIFYRDQQVRDMCSTYLPSVGNHLLTAHDNVADAYAGAFSFDFRRADDIGIDSTGPMEEWVNLWSVTNHLLEDLGNETKAAAVTLDLAMSDIGQQDTDAMDALERHAKEVAGVGTGDNYYIPWEDHRDETL